MTPWLYGQTQRGFAAGQDRWLAECGNAHCETGWLHLFRRRSAPRFEGKWACSDRCMESLVADAVRGQIENWEPNPGARALRMPLGLILLSRGWITQAELREALAAQREAGHGRIGEWLCRLYGLSGATLAKALAMQWNCAVLPAQVPGVEPVPALLPAYLRSHYGLVLLRQGQDGGLYLAARDRAEHAASRALEHMLGEPVQAAFIEDQCWHAMHNSPFRAEEEPVQPGPFGASARICDFLERHKPLDARLIRIHDHLWLRMWLRRDGDIVADDVLFSLRSEAGTLRPL